MGIVTNLFFIFVSIQLLADISPHFIQIHLTVDALIAESVKLLNGRVIRVLALHVSILS